MSEKNFLFRLKGNLCMQNTFLKMTGCTCKRVLLDLLESFMYISFIVPKFTNSINFYSLEGQGYKPERYSLLYTVSTKSSIMCHLIQNKNTIQALHTNQDVVSIRCFKKFKNMVDSL